MSGKYPVMCEKKRCLNKTEHCCTGPHLNCGSDRTGDHGRRPSCGMNGLFHIIMILPIVRCIKTQMLIDNVRKIQLSSS